MTGLIRREFIVNTPLRQAWVHLSRIESWPSWAKHIRRVELVPAGTLTAESEGRIHLRNGIRSTFRMVELNPDRNWKWAGQLLWLTIHYDHQFEAVDSRRTRLIWFVTADGAGESILGRLFTRIYERNLNTAIPALMAEMNASVA